LLVAAPLPPPTTMRSVSPGVTLRLPETKAPAPPDPPAPHMNRDSQNTLAGTTNVWKAPE
jgi:hypothetical protein